MALDLAHTHAARIHRHDLLVETGKPALIFGDQLRVEGSRTIARDRNLGGVRQNRLFRIAIAIIGLIAVRLSCLLGQMMIHLRIQHALGQGLFPLVE
jgi:hypothetical protein